MSKASSLVGHDIRRATVVLEAAAHNIGDEFLQYLYGMAALHLEEQSGNHQRIDPPPLNDFKIAIAAKLIVTGRGDRQSERAVKPYDHKAS